DLGYLDGEGRLVVAGRRDNRFVSGGENVQPEAIEAALLALPGVARAAVVPVDDAQFGARPAAFVAVEGGAVPDGAALGAALRARVPGYLARVASFPWPEGEEGRKPRRAALREEAARRVKTWGRGRNVGRAPHASRVTRRGVTSPSGRGSPRP